MNGSAGLRLDGVGFGALFDNVDLAVTPGTLAVVSGPSGAGKSVLAAILAGILAPSSGRALFDGVPLGNGTRRTEHPAFAPQESVLVSTLTAEETVGLPLQALGVKKSKVHERSVRWLGAFGLGVLTDRRVDELSGGQRQRVVLARAFAVESRAFVLDEPAAGLDADNRALVSDRILEARASGASVFCVSHDAELLERADLRYSLAPGPQGSRLVPA